MGTTIEKVEKQGLFPAPDEHWVLARDGEELASLSLWWKEASYQSTYPGYRVGLIGHFSTKGHAALLIEHACQRLAEEGCDLVIAPIDANTFFNHRLMIERGDMPLFFLEPETPEDWPDQFTDCGFGIFSTYCSALGEDLGYVDPRLPAVEARLMRKGVRIRNFDLNAFDRDLAKIYEVTSVAFSNNLLYAPITKEVFAALYQKVQPVLDPELVFIAEHGERTVGFLFALPDYLREPRDTMIIKTVAVLPERQLAGLGNLLWARTRAAAQKKGYQREIHAFMHEGNDSLTSSGRITRPFRRYALFARLL